MIVRKIFLFTAVAMLLASIPETASANESMRCGRHIVSAGQRHGPMQYEVLKKCGEPTSRSGNSWIYERPRTATRVFVFDFSGRLMRIERLGRR